MSFNMFDMFTPVNIIIYQTIKREEEGEDAALGGEGAGIGGGEAEG